MSAQNAKELALSSTCIRFTALSNIVKYIYIASMSPAAGVRSRHNWDRSLLVSGGPRLGAVLGLATYSATLLAVFVGRWIDGNLL